jgi:hypothetical protein
MTLLILEMLLALAVIIGIMVWTLKTRTDTPIDVGPDGQDASLPVLKTADDKTGVDDAGSGGTGGSGAPSSGSEGSGVNGGSGPAA